MEYLLKKIQKVQAAQPVQAIQAVVPRYQKGRHVLSPY